MLVKIAGYLGAYLVETSRFSLEASKEVLFIPSLRRMVQLVGRQEESCIHSNRARLCASIKPIAQSSRSKLYCLPKEINPFRPRQ